VIYLPDKTHSYAIDTSSKLSDYTFQVSRDEKGLLIAIEYKASTTVVGQQLAASAGAAAVQAYNVRAAQQAAVQAQVNTAAAAVDTANANLLAAKAALASDQAQNVPNLASDYNAVAQAAAKLQAAQQALQRVQQTAQAVSASVASGPAASTTEPTIGAIFGQPTWTTAAVANLPNKFGPVLFAINDTGSSVTLTAVTGNVPNSLQVEGKELEGGVVPGAQPAFETVATALGPPTLSPTTQAVSASQKTAKVVFSRPIEQLTESSVLTDPGGQPTNVKGTIGSDKETVSIDLTTLQPGDYVIGLTFTYKLPPDQEMPAVTLKAKFTVTK
jgi:hypothetical protein